MTATPYITLAQVRYLGVKVASDQAGKPSNRAKLLTLAIPNSNRYACIVPEKEGNEIGNSTCTRRTSRAMRHFFVRNAYARPQWAAMVGRLRPAGYLVRRFSNPAICCPPRLETGRSSTTVQGVCHGWITHI